jgi:hypothetical protein
MAKQSKFVCAPVRTYNNASEFPTFNKSFKEKQTWAGKQISTGF